MGETTLIDWTNVPGFVGGTWNCWQGCTKVSAGCKNCYMFRDKKRYGQNPSIVVRSAYSTFHLPEKTKDPHAFFTCSWSDFLHPTADLWRAEACEIIERNPQHLYLILTKRPERYQFFPERWLANWPANVWMGTTCENQEMADERLPIFLRIPARVHFVSVEPMLEKIDLDISGRNYGIDWPTWSERIDWVICGGESGPGARPMQLDWALDLRDQCQAANVPFFFKQVGGISRINGHWGGALLDGVAYRNFPEVTK